LVALKASYKGLFGISIAKTSQKPGDFDWGYSLGRSSLAFGGPNGKTYFFMLEKLDQVYPWGKTPRYSKEEAAEYAKSWSDWTLRPNMRFIDVFEKSTSFNLAVLEEGKFQLWFWGRIALLGDSIHKMTLSIGSGGNAAIESAAAFTNELTAVLDRCGDHLPTEDEIKACLKAYQTRRIDRTGATTNLAGGIMRMQAMEKPFHRIVVRYLLPYLDDFVANALSDSFVNAELLVSAISVIQDENLRVNLAGLSSDP
jgi:2-polyprenyl-6-methoxyphenol hydroxylase-like FAD-dependent oxidoreductase